MTDSEIPYWVLISVLFSSVPLTEALAMTLVETARDLHRRGADAGTVDGVLAKGELRSVQAGAAIGAISGPVFEAQLETERGRAVVRFILTQQGLALAEQLAPSKKPTVWN